jgi:hypothetical protein
MNTAILKLGIRGRGHSRYWVLKSGERVTVLGPGAHSFWPAAMSASWPHGGGRRSVRLDWHKAIAKAELRAIIAAECGED